MTAVDDLFAQLTQLSSQQSYPPVHLWHPEHEGSIDIRIDADGTWYHEGGRIARHALVKLFSGILRKDADGYCLVTPAERLSIVVEDVPFIAIDAEQGEGPQGPELIFTTNVGDYVTADAEHPIWIAGNEQQPRPYVMVRDNLAALISRPLYYRLVEACSEDADGFFIASRGSRFPLTP
jgi:hypothetical protein